MSRDLGEVQPVLSKVLQNARPNGDQPIFSIELKANLLGERLGSLAGRELSASAQIIPDYVVVDPVARGKVLFEQNEGFAVAYFRPQLLTEVLTGQNGSFFFGQKKSGIFLPDKKMPLVSQSG